LQSDVEYDPRVRMLYLNMTSPRFANNFREWNK